MTENKLNQYLDRPVNLDFVTRDGETSTVYNVLITGERDTWGKYTVKPTDSNDVYYLFPDEIKRVRPLPVRSAAFVVRAAFTQDEKELLLRLLSEHITDTCSNITAALADQIISKLVRK